MAAKVDIRIDHLVSENEKFFVNGWLLTGYNCFNIDKVFSSNTKPCNTVVGEQHAWCRALF